MWRWIWYAIAMSRLRKLSFKGRSGTWRSCVTSVITEHNSWNGGNGHGTPSVSGVYDVITRPYITKAQIQRGKLLAEGKIEAYILYLTDSNESPVYSMKKELPFSYMLDCRKYVQWSLFQEIKAEVKHTAYNLNVAGEIEIRCILSLNANIIRKEKSNLWMKWWQNRLKTVTKTV